MKTRLTKVQMEELENYVQDYKHRGVMGTFWELTLAVEMALKEIKLHRQYRRRK